MKQSSSSFWSFAVILLLMLLALLPETRLADDAFAASGSGSPAIDASCSQMQTYGFTAGIVYCVQTSIDTAVTQYVSAMQTHLRPYEGMMALLAVILFGIKMMNMGHEEPVKQAMYLLFRLLIGVFCYENATNIYHWVVGTPPTASNPFGGIMNEAIGWVTGTGGSGSGSGNMFSSLISSSCTPTTMPNTFEGYQVWQAFDCLFSRVMGAANPSDHPYAFSTSLLIIIAAALFSATMGVMLTVIGVTAFMSVLGLLFRSLYLVLMAYVCVGFMALFAPFIAPMLFFDSKFLTEKFTRWVGIIVSCIFQPVLVIGFLAMAIVIDDQIIEGNFSAPNCVLPTYPTSGSTTSGAPAQGWGQDGSGVCSFAQLFNQGQSGAPDESMQTKFHNIVDNNQDLFNETVCGDPQNLNSNNGLSNTTTVNPVTAAGSGTTGVINQAHPMLTNCSSINVNSATRLKNYAPVKQLILTLLTFVFVTYAMKELLEIIPDIAQSLTVGGIGINLAKNMTLPFQKGIDTVMDQVQGKANQLAAGRGIAPKVLQSVKGTSGTTRPGSVPRSGGPTG